jgi:hypothetical protein
MTLFLAFAAPQAVLVVFACVLAARGRNAAGATDVSRFGLASFACLRTFGSGREEEVGHSPAGGRVHPSIIGATTSDDDLDGELALE